MNIKGKKNFLEPLCVFEEFEDEVIFDSVNYGDAQDWDDLDLPGEYSW